MSWKSCIGAMGVIVKVIRFTLDTPGSGSSGPKIRKTMASECFERRGVWVNTDRDWNGRYYVAWQPEKSAIFRDSKELLRWLKWPPKTPTGDALREWIKRLETDDEANRKRPRPVTPLPPTALDDSDPNHNTRTII